MKQKENQEKEERKKIIKFYINRFLEVLNKTTISFKISYKMLGNSYVNPYFRM